MTVGRSLDIGSYYKIEHALHMDRRVTCQKYLYYHPGEVCVAALLCKQQAFSPELLQCQGGLLTLKHATLHQMKHQFDNK